MTEVIYWTEELKRRWREDGAGERDEGFEQSKATGGDESLRSTGEHPLIHMKILELTLKTFGILNTLNVALSVFVSQNVEQ